MEYATERFEEQQVIGITTRTANDAPDCGQKIGSLWQTMMGGEADYTVPEASLEPYTCFGLYYDYDFSDNSYAVMVGSASTSATVPDGMKKIIIPAGNYAKFSIVGDVVDDVTKAWNEIWAMDLPRSFTVDFEAYLPGEDMKNARIDIYIALK